MSNLNELFHIEKVTPDDAAELLAIYAPYVRDTAITYEYEVPSVEDFRRRIESFTPKYPYLKVVSDKGILGYAYAHPFSERKAYDWTVSPSIYLRQDARRMGLGKSLYGTLEKILRDMGICTMIACVVIPTEGDAHVTLDSYHFHLKMGYTTAGILEKDGFKFGIWYSDVYMTKYIGNLAAPVERVCFGEWNIPEKIN